MPKNKQVKFCIFERLVKTKNNFRINIQNKMHSKAVVKHPLQVKHPLHDPWTIWYLENDQKKTWEEMQNIVHTFNMVEDFWSIYNHIRQPSEISQGNDYSIFKNNIRPMWEDAANKNGGRWVLNVLKQHRRTKLDDIWLDTVSYQKYQKCPN